MRPQHFTLSEMTKTVTGLANAPETWEQVENLVRVALFLDEIREEFGKPIRVNCAFRSPAVNAKVGGVATSAHLRGCAADICAWSGTEADNRILLGLLEKRIANIDQLISYHRTAGSSGTAIRFIHVGLEDQGKAPRRQRLYK